MAEFAANCIQICDLLPRGRAGASNFKDQLARSATSAAANYAEATVPLSRRDFVGRLTIALKELAESRMHLSVISRLRYHRKITSNMMTALLGEADAIAIILNGAFKLTRSIAKAKVPAKATKSPKSSKPKITIAQVIKEADVEPKKRPGRKKAKSLKKPSTKSVKVAEPPIKKAKPAAKKKPPLKRKPKKPTLTKRPAQKKRPTLKEKPLAKRKRPKIRRVAVRKNLPQKFVAPAQLLLPIFTPPRLLTPPPRQHLLPFTTTRLLTWSQLSNS